MKVNLRYKDLSKSGFVPIVYGVTKDEGICITGNETSDDLSEYIVFSERCFAYNPYRVNIGSIGLSKDIQQGLVSPAYVVFKAKEDIEPEFLFYFLKSEIGLAQINWYGNRGGVRNALRYDALGEIDFPDLTRTEQKIALKRINRIKDDLDHLYSETNSQLSNIQLLRQAILQEAVQGKLVPQDPKDEPANELLRRIKAEKAKQTKKGKKENYEPITDVPYEIPEGWVWCSIAEMSTKVSDGEHATPRRASDGHYLLSARNVTDKGIDLSDVDYVPVDEYQRIRKRCNPDKGDILMSCSGSIGRTAIVDADNKYVMVRSAAFIKSDWNLFNSKYLMYSIKSPIVQSQILAKSKTSAISNLFIGKILELLIPLPPIKEQKRIVAKVEQLMQLCDELEAQVQQSKTDAEKLLQAVLREAFEGKKTYNSEDAPLSMAAEP